MLSLGRAVASNPIGGTCDGEMTCADDLALLQMSGVAGAYDDRRDVNKRLHPSDKWCRLMQKICNKTFNRWCKDATTTAVCGPERQLVTPPGINAYVEVYKFDMVALGSDIQILELGVNVFATLMTNHTTFAVWAKPSAYAQGDCATGWTLVANTSGMLSSSALPFNVPWTIPAGQTHGFLLTHDESGIWGVKLSSTSTGQVVVNDTFAEIRAGVAVLYSTSRDPNGACSSGITLENWVWDGSVSYCPMEQR